MNGKAAELGCDDTYFLTPNGLDAEDKESGKIHSTTAADPGADPQILYLTLPGEGRIPCHHKSTVPRFF